MEDDDEGPAANFVGMIDGEMADAHAFGLSPTPAVRFQNTRQACVLIKLMYRRSRNERLHGSETDQISSATNACAGMCAVPTEA